MAIDKLKVVVDDILVTIKQTFDDKVVSRAQVAYWTIIVANQLLGQHNAKRDSGAFLSTFTGIPIKIATANVNPDIVKGRKYIELPASIFDFDRDGGVEYLAYYDPDENCLPEFQRKTFTRTTPAEIEWLRLNKYTMPSPSRPYWYRTGEVLYLVGIESVPIKFIEMGAYMTIDPLEKIDIDKPFKFPAELLHVLKRQVTDLARFSFLFGGEDKANDGNDSESDNVKQVPKIISVNEQNQ